MKSITDMANSSLSCLLRNHFLKQILPHWLHYNRGSHFFFLNTIYFATLCANLSAFKNPNSPASSDPLRDADQLQNLRESPHRPGQGQDGNDPATLLRPNYVRLSLSATQQEERKWSRTFHPEKLCTLLGHAVGKELEDTPKSDEDQRTGWCSELCAPAPQGE